jgi:DNA replication and repair protein RecF
MFLQELRLHQFRCFQDQIFKFDQQISVITGDNGSGKTSIIEAIYYLAYAKSFRAAHIAELVQQETDTFFLKGEFISVHEQHHTIQVGYGQRKKSIKFDEKSIASHKELLSIFQVVTLTEDDIDLIKGAPAHRRAFIDQAVVFKTPEILDLYKKFRQILIQRNTFLEQNFRGFDPLEHEIWTQKLWEISVQIAQKRTEILLDLQTVVNQLLQAYFEGIYQVGLDYQPKVQYVDCAQFLAQNQPLFNQERAWKRSLFGAHLDDITFEIRGQKARIFASRGQQKLIILLCKLALTQLPGGTKGLKPLFLMDDFISDFDKIRLKNLAMFFSNCNNQIIITAPFYDKNLQDLLGNADCKPLGGRS